MFKTLKKFSKLNYQIKTKNKVAKPKNCNSYQRLDLKEKLIYYDRVAMKPQSTIRESNLPLTRCLRFQSLIPVSTTTMIISHIIIILSHLLSRKFTVHLASHYKRWRSLQLFNPESTPRVSLNLEHQNNLPNLIPILTVEPQKIQCLLSIYKLSVKQQNRIL